MKNRKDRGLTLTEVVIAMGILAVIMMIAYSSLRQITRTKTILDDKRDAQKIANSVLSRMTRELQLAYDGVPLMPARDNLKTPRKSRENLIGKAKKIGTEHPADSITFIALEGGQYLPDGGSHSGLVQITYRVEEDPELEPDEEKRFYLIREETPYIRPFKNAYEKQTMIFPITNRLTGFQLQYYDLQNETWVNEWGTGTNLKLPALVHFVVEIVSPRGKKESFAATVPMRISR